MLFVMLCYNIYCRKVGGNMENIIKVLRKIYYLILKACLMIYLILKMNKLNFGV